jgi:hypothetical protein
VSAQLEEVSFFFKALVNESAIVFFPASSQHRDIKVHGLSYQDDYSGNALAATISPDRVDFRHTQPSPQRVSERLRSRFCNIPSWIESEDFSSFIKQYR